jgi:ATP-dependent phosphofructokinase / diphosphate-dependent phosphofructokinase
MSDVKRIGVLTGGGDAPGLNAVIRAVVKSACNAGIDCVGLRDSFAGLIEPGKWRLLGPKDVTGILRIGGTILGTNNRTDPFAYTVPGLEGTVDRSEQVLQMFHGLGLDALIVIGGDGTLKIAGRFLQMGIPVVGVPKTIDNDIVGTTSTFGFDTAVAFATDAIDRLHTTAEAHRRIIVVEVMGRHAGWIALRSGIGGGADVILIPELPFDLEKTAALIRERDRWGARFSIVVVAEGAKPVGGSTMVKTVAAAGEGMDRLGGVGACVGAELERLTGKETRVVVLGHLQRGGAPTPADRVLATRFGAKAVDLVRSGQFGTMVANRPPDIVAIPLDEVVGRSKFVPPDSDLIATARAMGIGFGD